MPIYDYECKKCGSRFSVLQPVTAPREGARCPTCESTDTHRVVSTFSSQTESGGSCSTSSPFT